MSEALRNLFSSRGAPPSPLREVREHVARHGPPDAASLRDLAARVRMPVTSLRAAVSYFADLHAEPAELRVCEGTSCALAGAGRLRDELSALTSCRTVYCVGHCDRSPALLAGERVVLPGPHARAASVLDQARTTDGVPPASDVRCLSPTPIVSRRLGRGGFTGLDEARAEGAYAALERALAGRPEDVLAAVVASGERGRGGAGFSTGHKWRAASASPGPMKYVVANGDEGDPGSFVDRALMEDDPHGLIEGMALCGLAVGATEGIVFIRSEYPRALAAVEGAIAEARTAGVLGSSVMGSRLAFDVTVFPGMGSYVCGEETALLSTIEGFRGEVRPRPPYPVESGLFGRPTVVNNVETLVNVPWIVENGPDAYRALGTASSPGTKAMCLNAGFVRPGIVEVAFGTPLAALLDEGGGTDGLIAVLLGGPMGSVVRPRNWDVPISYEAMSARGVELGHGGVVAVSEHADLGALLDHWLTFMAEESCGKCVPCRLGSRELLNMARDGRRKHDPAAFGRLLHVVEQGSLCAFGQRIPVPVRELVALVQETSR
jgi:NADH:ubiquinone oxidoreductase subunit F (NADH-binding)